MDISSFEKPLKFTILIVAFWTLPFSSPSQVKEKLPDVIHYQAEIEPNFEDSSITGTVKIAFKLDLEQTNVRFDCGNLKIISVNGRDVDRYSQENGHLSIYLSERIKKDVEVEIFYRGQPKRGLIFKKDPTFTYTVFSTDQWMVCNMDPSDKARFALTITAPDSLDVIMSNANQNSESPAYTFGFAIGLFDSFSEEVDDLTLSYYSDQYSSKQLSKIFAETPRIMAFLAEKASVPYNQNDYSQVLAGDYYQEMAGFAMIKSSYGTLVLEDTTETNLITHELAHQWWGNQVTCESWNHFWLNEGFATYLSAAYNEIRFGKDTYQSEIESYYQVYKKIKEKGADKPLVFPDWSNPSRDDRNIVYFKGAYVLHLLREKVGDDIFWEGLKLYTQENLGKSVATSAFQKAMELAYGKSLESFFNEWVY